MCPHFVSERNTCRIAWGERYGRCMSASDWGSCGIYNNPARNPTLRSASSSSSSTTRLRRLSLGQPWNTIVRCVIGGIIGGLLSLIFFLTLPGETQKETILQIVAGIIVIGIFTVIGLLNFGKALSALTLSALIGAISLTILFVIMGIIGDNSSGGDFGALIFVGVLLGSIAGLIIGALSYFLCKKTA